MLDLVDSNVRLAAVAISHGGDIIHRYGSSMNYNDVELNRSEIDIGNLSCFGCRRSSFVSDSFIRQI